MRPAITISFIHSFIHFVIGTLRKILKSQQTCYIALSHLSHTPVIFQGVKFAPTSPERLGYTAENSQISTPTTEKKELKKGIEKEIGL